jgi:hypothetical protein
MLWFFDFIEQTRMTIATAALFSRAMKAGLMAEQLHFGNDEPRNRLRRQIG